MNAPTSYQLLEFSSANLFGALSNNRCDRNEVAANPRAQYLVRYLHDVSAKWIVVEKNYTDGDYLDDFASYYARCFASYKSRCKRLHFFACDLDEKSFQAFASGQEPEHAIGIRDAYLGFVVARPLPVAVVGRTLLRTYDHDSHRRYYPVVRPYLAHLFGATLSVKSLPFQEQDTVLAACATVALWSAFHKTAELFGTTAPRPAAITSAANQAGHRGRAIPSHGLRMEEMCHAVRSVGLEPELVDWVGTRLPLISLAYAYLSAGLPVILGVRIGSDLHALTLTGYSLRDKVVHPKGELPQAYQYLPLIGLRIDELYGHDDQVGPFSRLQIDTTSNPASVVLKSDSPDGSQREMLPTAALIPVYNKIRVTFQDVIGWLRRLHVVVEVTVSDPSKTIEWDLHLITTTSYKEEIAGATTLTIAQRERLLFKQQPRFLWRAILRIAGTKSLELLADATGLGRSLPLVDVVWYHQKFKASMKAVLTPAPTQGTLSDILTPRFLDRLKKSF